MCQPYFQVSADPDELRSRPVPRDPGSTDDPKPRRLISCSNSPEPPRRPAAAGRADTTHDRSVRPAFGVARAGSAPRSRTGLETFGRPLPRDESPLATDPRRERRAETDRVNNVFRRDVVVLPNSGEARGRVPESDSHKTQ